MMFSLCTLLVSQKGSSLIASLDLSCEFHGFHGISTISWNCSCCLMFSLCSLLVSLFLAVADELQPQCEARACSHSLHRTTSFISKLRHVGHRTQLFVFFAGDLTLPADCPWRLNNYADLQREAVFEATC